MQGLQGTKIALLIDFDNVILGVDDPGFDVELVVNALRSRGVVVMGRAYGDWYRHHRHRRKLMEQGIELVETPVFGPLIKNSADIRIVLDGIEVATSHPHIDAFCLVSGDSDFLPLIKRLQLLGKSVMVIAGNKFTSDLVRRNCNEYIAYENLLAESVGATEDVSTLEGAYHLLERTINTLLERGMDVRSSTVKQMMLQLNPAFSERTFGCNQFKQFLDKAVRAGAVRLGPRDGTSGEYAVLLAGDENPVASSAAELRRDSTARDANGRDADSRNGEARSVASRNGRRRGRSPRAESSEAENAGATPVAGNVSSAGDAAVPTAASQPSTSTSGGAADTPVLPELFASSGDDSAAEDALLSSTASGTARGALRRGRLRFSAKSGRSTLVPRAGATPSASGAEAVNTEEVAVGAAEATVGEAPMEAANGDASTVQETSPELQPVAAAGDKPEDAVSLAGVESGASIDGDGGDPSLVKNGRKRAARGGRRRKSPAASDNGTDAETPAVPGDVAAGDVAAGDVADGASSETDVTESAANATASEVADAMTATQAVEDPTAANANTAPSGDAPGDVSDGEAQEAGTGTVKKKATRSRRGGVRRPASRPAKDSP